MYIEPKPDESRLLTNDNPEFNKITSELHDWLLLFDGAKFKPYWDKILDWLERSNKAQLAKDQEHEQQKVERIFNDIGEKLEAVGLSLRYLRILRSEWQEFKKQEGVNEG